MLKFAIIREEKTPPDRRVVFSPKHLKKAKNQFPEAQFKVQTSAIRIFKDEEYQNEGFQVSEDISDCEVMIGVKEVPIDSLIPNKKYFFFSHTIKKQPYNRDLLKAILDKNIELFDHEVITSESGMRLIGFGRYAGLVGAYNGFRAIGLKNDIFNLPKADDLPDLNAMLDQLDKIKVPNLKIVLTGSGKVSRGAKEILDHLKIRQVEVTEYLASEFEEPVYCHIDVLDYNKRLDGNEGSIPEFFKNPELYESDFWRFAVSSDFFIAGHFYGQGAPVFFTKEEAKTPNFRIKYIADISCDIAEPIPSTIRASTITDPIYGYDPKTETETDYKNPDAITVMAVDNLPCELPKDASEGFGEMFLENVLPAFFNNDENGILERARMTKDGKLTPRYSYLQDFVS
ncbi:NAD(P)-dependent oxidoreductase [Zunongwangia endophytica]|uniref:Saccharopine dehydrogenase [NAD(+), L-lysine-forming] n=1 Tax=Zunongwangia endophytica TaxID=1808945 RepID=A0ABV8HAU1_9FLAO|nr:NAD(P)-dependent oxidoreductase [Zunongwangia endophytica]MDN3596644.1 NAD(P)-dependent oxidoreductase [Zunongwangia endophytica]